MTHSNFHFWLTLAESYRRSFCLTVFIVLFNVSSQVKTVILIMIFLKMVVLLISSPAKWIKLAISFSIFSRFLSFERKSFSGNHWRSCLHIASIPSGYKSRPASFVASRLVCHSHFGHASRLKMVVFRCVMPEFVGPYWIVCENP